MVLPPSLVQRVGQALELLVAGPALRALPHVDLPMVAAQRLQEVAAEGDMVGDGLGDLVGIDEIGGLALLAIRSVDEGDARHRRQLFSSIGLLRYCSMPSP